VLQGLAFNDAQLNSGGMGSTDFTFSTINLQSDPINPTPDHSATVTSLESGRQYEVYWNVKNDDIDSDSVIDRKQICVLVRWNGAQREIPRCLLWNGQMQSRTCSLQPYRQGAFMRPMVIKSSQGMSMIEIMVAMAIGVIMLIVLALYEKIPECSTCSQADICRGGCRSNATLHGSQGLASLDPYCQYFKSHIE
jgi:hypothetical protein